jgi:hypothetical protein
VARLRVSLSGALRDDHGFVTGGIRHCRSNSSYARPFALADVAGAGFGGALADGAPIGRG